MRHPRQPGRLPGVPALERGLLLSDGGYQLFGRVCVDRGHLRTRWPRVPGRTRVDRSHEPDVPAAFVRPVEHLGLFVIPSRHHPVRVVRDGCDVKVVLSVSDGLTVRSSACAR